MIIGLDRRAKIARDVHARRFEGELVIVDLRGGDYWTLDALGMRLWDALEAGQTTREVAVALEPVFEVDPQTLLRDLETLTEELARRGFIVCREP